MLIGLSKGGLPVIAMLSVPLLSLTMSPITAAALLLPIYILTDAVGVWLYRREYSAPNLKILIPSGLAGILIAWATVAYVSDEIVGLLVGLVGIGYCLNRWIRSKPSDKAAPTALGKGIFWGTVAGFTSFVAHAGGPPYQIYVLPQKLRKEVFAGTSTILFAIINLAKVVPYQFLQPYTASVLSVSLKLIPAAILGTFLGRYLTRVLPEKWYFLGVQIALFLVCLKLVYSAI